MKDIMKLLEIYREILPTKPKVFGLGSGEHLKNFLQASDHLSTEDDWRVLFDKVANSPYLMSKSWCNLLWLVNFDNALKVLCDHYDSFNDQVKKINAQAIRDALKSGACNLNELDATLKKRLSESDIRFIRDNGGLLQLGQRTTEFELDRLIKGAE